MKSASSSSAGTAALKVRATGQYLHNTVALISSVCEYSTASQRTFWSHFSQTGALVSTGTCLTDGRFMTPAFQSGSTCSAWRISSGLTVTRKETPTAPKHHRPCRASLGFSPFKGNWAHRHTTALFQGHKRRLFVCPEFSVIWGF